jgi:hypothetical protein
MADDSGSVLFLFSKNNAYDIDRNRRRQNNVKLIAFLSALPATNEEGKPVCYLLFELFIFTKEVELIQNIDNIEDDYEIRRIDETQSLVAADINSITDNDEAHPVTTEDIIIINNNNDIDTTDPLATEDIINTPDNA